MAEHALTRQVPQEAVEKAMVNTQEERSTRIVVLTDDPRRKVVIVPGCHLDSMGGQEANAYFFEDGNALVGMIVEGGTVEYDRAERTYVVRLTS